jgi:hypothetical protein
MRSDQLTSLFSAISQLIFVLESQTKYKKVCIYSTFPFFVSNIRYGQFSCDTSIVAKEKCNNIIKKLEFSDCHGNGNDFFQPFFF